MSDGHVDESIDSRRQSSWKRRLSSLTPSMKYVDLFRGLQPVEGLLLFVGTLASIAAGVPLPIIGLLFGKMVDGFNRQACASRSGMPTDPAERDDFLHQVSNHVVQIIIVAAINFVLIWIYTCSWSLLGERIVRRLREQYVRAILSQDMAFFDVLPPGEISTRLSENLITVQNGTSEKVGIFLSSVSYFLTSYIIAFVLLPALAGELVSLIPAFLIVSLVGAHFVSKFSAQMSSHLGNASGIATESLNNVRAVQAFEAQKPLCKLYNSHLHLVRRSGLFRALSAATMLGCLFFVAYSANALAFHSGSRMVTDRMRSNPDDASSTVGSVYTVIFLLLDASFVVGQIAPYLQTFSAAGGAGSQLLTTISQESPINALSDTGTMPPLSSEALGFHLRNVTLAYPARPDAKVLDNVDLDIEPGTRVGICGFSGSGKSTIVALLHRYYMPLEGQVTLHDDTPIDELNVGWLRSQMGLVGQEPVLFDCTVLESIAHGLLGSSSHNDVQDAIRWLSRYAFDHAVIPKDWSQHCPSDLRPGLQRLQALCEEAAQLAHAHEFILQLPHGYLSRVGDAGRCLSGGQKQRIALARAIVKKPRILILDEATAALDSQSEMAVQTAFDRVSQNRTTIAIAHRLSTIKHYDKIVVMAHGKVMEQGTHAELLALNAHYASLVRAQSDHGENDVEQVSTTESTGEQKVAAVEDDCQEDDDKQDVVDPAPLTSMALPLPTQPVVPPATMGDVEGIHPQEPEPMSVLKTEPDQLKSRRLSYSRSLVRLMRWALMKWPFAVAGFLASAVIGGAFSGEAVLFGHVIEALNPCKPAREVEHQSDLFALYFFVLAIIELFCYFVSGAAFGFVSEWLLLRIRKLMFRALVTQPLAWYERKDLSPATMIANLSADTSNLGGLTGTVVGTIFSILVNFVAGITLAHIVAWRIAVVILATVPILVTAGYMRLKVIADFQKRHETAYARSTAIAVEAASCIRTVAALGRERDLIQLFSYSLERPYRESMRHILMGNACLAISLSISYFIYGFAYWWGSKNVAEERFSQVAFFTVLPALLFSAQSSGQLLAFAPDFTKAQVSASNIFSMLDQARHPVDMPGYQWPDRRERRRLRQQRKHQHYLKDLESEKSLEPVGAHGPLAVSFDHVWFTYPGRDKPALRDVVLDIPAGSFAAFIGCSGSGKSTAMSLIEAFYEPTLGTVRVGGCSTTHIPTKALREHMALVPQEAMLFHGSIEFNVALGLADPLSVEAVMEETHAHRQRQQTLSYACHVGSHQHASAKARVTQPDERILAACRAAKIHDAIAALPDQYRTNIGSGGSQLSGGQKQRVSIARALVRAPRLLLLDESTSAMDASSEKAFQETLSKLHSSRSCTIVAIAHRMRTIRTADVIFLFDQGRIVARGTHDELIKTCSRYQAMISHQSLSA